MLKEKLLQRIQEIKLLGTNALKSTRQSDWRDYVESGGACFRSSGLSFIEKIYGSDHSYYKSFHLGVEDSGVRHINYGLEILQAIEQEIQGDWLVTIRGLVAADLFSDFLEMANHLLEEGFKDPAAVMIGSVLEEHLRQLCVSHNIDIEIQSNGKTTFRKADRLNADLVKAGVYTKLYQKQITAWLDLRNNAAHGKYNGYDIDQTTLMHAGVLDFLIKHPVS